MMKKFIAAIIVSVFAVGAASAAEPVLVRRAVDKRGYEAPRMIQYTGADALNRTGWYAAIKGMLNFINHGYYLTDPTVTPPLDGEKTDEAVAFGAQLGAEINVGKYMNDKWRVQFDFGMLGKYEDAENWDITGYSDGHKFVRQVYYGAFDGIYSAGRREWGGLYYGAGLGLAFVDSGLNPWGSLTENNVSPMGQLLFGYENEIRDGWMIDVGLKTSFLYGVARHYRGFWQTDVQVGTGLVWNLAMTIGIRYDF